MATALEQAFVGANIPFFPYGRGNLGRTPVVSQTDLKLTQSLPFGDRYDVQIAMTVLNLFDQDTVTRYSNNRTAGSVPVTTAGSTTSERACCSGGRTTTCGCALSV